MSFRCILLALALASPSAIEAQSATAITGSARRKAIEQTEAPPAANQKSISTLVDERLDQRVDADVQSRLQDPRLLGLNRDSSDATPEDTSASAASEAVILGRRIAGATSWSPLQPILSRPRPSRWRRHSRTACRHRLSYLLRAAEQMPVAIFLQRARMIFGNRAEAFNPNPSSPACKFRRRSGPSGRRAKSRGNPFSNASNCIQIRRNADCSWTERPQVLIDMGSRFPSCRPAHAELSYLVRKRPSISPGGTTLTRNHATLPATSYIPISRR